MPRRSAIVCTVCGHVGVLGNGPGGRPDARCLSCSSLERHRALLGFLRVLAPHAEAGIVLDVAPTRVTSDHIASLASEVDSQYVSIDFDPGADNRRVRVQTSLTDLPLSDATVGLLVCSHVLEHIPDDAKAMGEISRVLHPSGIAMIQVPRRLGTTTDEDPSVTDTAERVRRFGQADHVRYYGDDFEDRLRAAGLHVRTLVQTDLYPTYEAELLGLVLDEEVWLCTTGESLDVEQIAATASQTAREAIAYGIAAVSAERDALRSRIAPRPVRRSRARRLVGRGLRKAGLRR